MVPEQVVREAKRTLCKFFQQGMCKKGDECTFAHGEEELVLLDPLDEQALDPETGEPRRTLPKGVKRTICSFWQRGNCQRGELCGFAHGEEEIGDPVPEAADSEHAHKRARFDYS